MENASAAGSQSKNPATPFSNPEQEHAPLHAGKGWLSCLKQDILNGNTELDATFQEAALETCAIEFIFPLLKDTTADIGSENIENDFLSILEKLSDHHTENTTLKKKLLEKEIYIQELSSLFQNEKANALKANRFSESVKVVHERLQLQIHKKEAENKKLKEYINSLEVKIAKWNFQLEKSKHETVAMKELRKQKTIALRKASKLYKQRHERFTRDMEILASQIKHQEAKLTETISATNAWKSHYEKIIIEKNELEVQIKTMKKQITTLLEDLKKLEDYEKNSCEEIHRKLHLIEYENETLNLENKKLKNILAALKDEVVSVSNELLELQEVERQQKSLIEVYKTQIQKLQEATEIVKSRCENLLHENELVAKHKNEKLEKMRGQLEAHLQEAEHIRGSLMETEHRLQQCQESLRLCQGLCTHQAYTISELQAQIDQNHNLLTNISLEEEDYLIQLKCENLKEKLEQVDAENKELEKKLANQEECLKHNNIKFKVKSAEYISLAKKLDAALEEGRQKVSDEKEKMTSRERVLQIKILDLESELRKKKEEQSHLVCNMSSIAQQQEACLRKIQQNLKKLENQNESMKNYLEFLKTSYVTMFG